MIKLCKQPNCKEKHYAKGKCFNHYRSDWRIENDINKRDYQKVKSNPELLAKTKKSIDRHRNTDEYREKRKVHDKKYVKKNRSWLKKYWQLYHNVKRFGAPRQAILDRDNNKCTTCHSTKSLVVHHVDGNGRGSKKPNNDPDNLLTLCRSCHMKLHLYE